LKINHFNIKYKKINYKNITNKISIRQTILSKELRNPDSPFLMEICRSKVKHCRAPSKNKK